MRRYVNCWSQVRTRDGRETPRWRFRPGVPRLAGWRRRAAIGPAGGCAPSSRIAFGRSRASRWARAGGRPAPWVSGTKKESRTRRWTALNGMKWMKQTRTVSSVSRPWLRRLWSASRDPWTARCPSRVGASSRTTHTRDGTATRRCTSREWAPGSRTSPTCQRRRSTNSCQRR